MGLHGKKMGYTPYIWVTMVMSRSLCPDYVHITEPYGKYISIYKSKGKKHRWFGSLFTTFLPRKSEKNALETNRDILDDGKYPITRYVVICNVIA
jgi:hypothetical protein